MLKFRIKTQHFFMHEFYAYARIPLNECEISLTIRMIALERYF